MMIFCGFMFIILFWYVCVLNYVYLMRNNKYFNQIDINLIIQSSLLYFTYTFIPCFICLKWYTFLLLDWLDGSYLFDNFISELWDVYFYYVVAINMKLLALHPCHWVCLWSHDTWHHNGGRDITMALQWPLSPHQISCHKGHFRSQIEFAHGPRGLHLDTSKQFLKNKLNSWIILSVLFSIVSDIYSNIQLLLTEFHT